MSAACIRGDGETLGIEMARSAGMTAAVRGRPYSSNPHHADPARRLAWSQGHNGMRARIAMDKEDKGN